MLRECATHLHPQADMIGVAGCACHSCEKARHSCADSSHCSFCLKNGLRDGRRWNGLAFVSAICEHCAQPGCHFTGSHYICDHSLNSTQAKAVRSAYLIESQLLCLTIGHTSVIAGVPVTRWSFGAFETGTHGTGSFCGLADCVARLTSELAA